jgi:hypothetical protein
MKTHRKIPVLLVLGWCGMALAGPSSVSWILGQTPPAGWVVTPANPTSSQVVSYSGPTAVYSNSCVAQGAMGGSPLITIDNTAKVVELGFEGPPPDTCTLIYMPVCGLQGQFGPLTAGRWTFRAATAQGSFDVRFTVGITKVIYVDADSPSSAPNGTTWAKAYKKLQDGLAVAWGGDEIRVAEGTYTPNQTWQGRAVSFQVPAGVKVKGGYAGNGNPNPNARDVTAYATVLSGDLAGDDLWGILNRTDNCYHVVTVGPGYPAATLDGLTITAGQADGPYPDQCGGGLYVSGANPRVINCVLKENTGVFGGGLACLSGSVSMANCTLSGNRALLLGGAGYLQDGTLDLVNTLIVGNSADQAAAMGSSALYSLGGSLSLADCTVADNVAPQGMAIASLVWGSPVTDTITVTNSILYNGGTEISSNDTSIVTVAYSDVQGGWSGTGNLNTAPHFVTPGAHSIEGQWIDGDYHLQGSSPCIDKGDKTSLPADLLDVDGDGNVIEKLPIDRAGAARVQGTQVDMGAYEQVGSGPGPGPGGSWVTVASIDVNYDVPNPPPGFPISVSGSGGSDVILNFKALLKIEATAASAGGGTWTAAFNPDPNPIGPGTVHVNYTIHGVNFLPYNLTAGATNVKIATLTISAQPAP